MCCLTEVNPAQTRYYLDLLDLDTLTDLLGLYVSKHSYMHKGHVFITDILLMIFTLSQNINCSNFPVFFAPYVDIHYVYLQKPELLTILKQRE